MREIKFRGKRTKDGEWVYGFYVREDGFKEDGLSHTIITKREPFRLYQDRVYADTVGQYTGLKDKNGVEIYEGDVVKGYYYINGVKKRIVGRVMFGYNGWIIASDIMWERATIVLTSACEVIGNIHDNPELLGGSHEA